MGKPELINVYDEESMRKIGKPEQFNMSSGFGWISKPYYTKALEGGATKEEAIEGLAESIIKTEPPISLEKMTQIIKRAWPEYEPNAGRIKANQKIHEDAARAYVALDYERRNNVETRKISDRAAQELYRWMPELGAENLEKAYQERLVNDDYSNMVMKAHKGFFTKERMEFYTKPRSDEEFVRDWPELYKINQYIAESENLLKDVRKNVVSGDERTQLFREAGEFLEYAQYYRGRMAFIASPNYMVMDSELLQSASPITQVQILDEAALAYDDYIAAGNENGRRALGDLEGTFKAVADHNFNGLQIAIMNRVVDPNKLESGMAMGEFKETYELLQQDGKKLKNIEEATKYILKTGEILYVRHKETGERTPIALTDKKNLTYSVGDQIAEVKATKPKEPGFFSRMFSSIKEAFTGTPTETVRQYREDLAKYEYQAKIQENYQQFKQAEAEQAAQKKEAKPVQVKEEKVAEKAVEKTKVSEKVNDLDATVKTEMQAACETLANNKSGPEAITAVGTLLTCAALVEAKQSVSPEQFTAIRGDLMKSEDFRKMQSNVEGLSDMVKESYQKGDLSSCLKVTDKMTMEMSRVNAQPQKVMAAPQLQKTMSKGGMEL